MLAVQTAEKAHVARPLARIASASLDQRMAQAGARRLAPRNISTAKGMAGPRFPHRGGRRRRLQDAARWTPTWIIDFSYPGDLIGLGVLEVHMLSAQATCAAKVRCLSASALERMAESDAHLALKLYKCVCQELAVTRSLLVTVGQRGAVERIAAFLVGLHRRTASQGSMTVTLAMRRSDIAVLPGLTIETVSRTFTKLREMGVIELEQGGTRVDLCDLARLSDLANE